MMLGIMVHDISAICHQLVVVFILRYVCRNCSQYV